MKNGIIIGKSLLFDFLDGTFWLVYCSACDGLFNAKNIKEILTCPLCHEKIIIKSEKILSPTKFEDKSD